MSCAICGKENICGVVQCKKTIEGISVLELTENEIKRGKEICCKHCFECEYFDQSISLCRCRYAEIMKRKEEQKNDNKNYKTSTDN